VEPLAASGFVRAGCRSYRVIRSSSSGLGAGLGPMLGSAANYTRNSPTILRTLKVQVMVIQGRPGCASCACQCHDASVMTAMSLPGCRRHAGFATRTIATPSLSTTSGRATYRQAGGHASLCPFFCEAPVVNPPALGLLPNQIVGVIHALSTGGILTGHGPGGQRVDNTGSAVIVAFQLAQSSEASGVPALLLWRKIRLNEHWDGGLGAFNSGLTNGRAEGINSLIQAAKARAGGYRTHSLITIAYLIRAQPGPPAGLAVQRTILCAHTRQVPLLPKRRYPHVFGKNPEIA
jgi:Transposase